MLSLPKLRLRVKTALNEWCWRVRGAVLQAAAVGSCRHPHVWRCPSLCPCPLSFLWSPARPQASACGRGILELPRSRCLHDLLLHLLQGGLTALRMKGSFILVTRVPTKTTKIQLIINGLLGVHLGVAHKEFVRGDLRNHGTDEGVRQDGHERTDVPSHHLWLPRFEPY